MQVRHAPGISLRVRGGVESGLLWRSIPKTQHRRRRIRASLLPKKKHWTWLKKRPWSLSPRVTRLLGTQVAQGSAFLRSRRVKRSPLLFHFRAATLRTLHFVLIVFSHG